MSPTPDPARTVATTGATPSSSVVGDLGLHGPCRHIGSGTALATLAALTLALNPIYFGLSCTFMTDVPFTVLLILSILGLFVGLDTGRDRFLRIGLAAAFAAQFVRQLALAVFLAFLVASPLRLGFGRRWLLYAMSPMLLAGVSLAAYSRVLAHFGRLPGMYYLNR